MVGEGVFDGSDRLNGSDGRRSNDSILRAVVGGPRSIMRTESRGFWLDVGPAVSRPKEKGSRESAEKGAGLACRFCKRRWKVQGPDPNCDRR